MVWKAMITFIFKDRYEAIERYLFKIIAFYRAGESPKVSELAFYKKR